MSDDGCLTTATITITRTIDADGHDTVWLEHEPENMTLVEILGLLALSHDTAIHDAAEER